MLSTIKEISQEDHRSTAEIIREAMENYIKQKKRKRKLSIIGITSSSRRDIAERHEDILFEEFKEWRQ